MGRSTKSTIFAAQSDGNVCSGDWRILLSGRRFPGIVRNASSLHYSHIRLGAPCNDKRIAVVTEAAPNRWTHHTLVHRPEDIDDILLGWLKSAAQFSIEKGLSSDS